MKLHSKLLAIAVLPLIVSFGLNAWLLRHQQGELAKRQRELVHAAFDRTVRAEMQNYVALALSTIAPLYNSGLDDEEAKRLAIQQLKQLEYGPDGYFFLYEFDGTNLMHPRQPELQGKNLLDMRDAGGRPVIQLLIDQAKKGGGFVHYSWNKPSVQTEVSKIAYVTGLPRWRWMLGTGVYEDDIKQVMTKLEAQLDSNVDVSIQWVGVSVGGSAVFALIAVLALSWSELRSADTKLTLLARKVVRSQEEERARLSRELHDDTGQMLVAVRLLTESAIERLVNGHGNVVPMLQRTMQHINRVLTDVRNMSHRLRPVELDTLGLTAALRDLGMEMCGVAGARFRLRTGNVPESLPEEITTTLFRVAQEALTNVAKHARATQVQILLDQTASNLRLVVVDNGCGFDLAAVTNDPRRGIGLRNIRERLSAIDSHFEVASRRRLTVLSALVPLDVIQRFARTE